jgi:UMF1 family MFS transporter
MSQTADESHRPGRGVLNALGLHRKELRAWAMYDWANSAFATTVMAGVLPVYYASVAGATLPGNRATVYWAYTSSIALAIIAVLSPLLGAAADYLGAKKRFLGIFAVLGIGATALLYFAGSGDWLFASVVFILGNIGFAGANVFYESLLPSLVSDDELDRVSTAGYAIGYIGGGVLLALNLAWILKPELFGFSGADEASRASFVSVAVWWAVFSIPLFRRVPEPPRQLEEGETDGQNPFRVGFARVWETLREIRQHREVFVFLLAFWLYNDGIGTIIKMATIYGAEIGIGQSDLIGALLVVQFVGIPFTFAFGMVAGRIGAKRGLYVALFVYTGISMLGYFMQEAWQFWMLAFGVATVQGGSQALSRSLFASMIPRGKSSQFFGFFSVSAKFAGIIGPLLFGVIGQVTGGSRLSILSLVVFFIGGMALLSQVDVEAGQRAARAEDATLVPAD